jgi:hypothetical protein
VLSHLITRCGRVVKTCWSDRFISLFNNGTALTAIFYLRQEKFIAELISSLAKCWWEYRSRSPGKPIVCVESAQAFLFASYVSIKCLTIVQAIDGKFPCFLRLFFYILEAGIYVAKTVKKCLQFVYIFADLLPVKCQTKFLILQLNVWQIVCYCNQFFKELSAQCLYNSMKQ